MQSKGLLIAVALLAVLGGLVFWSNKQEAAKASKGSTDTTKIFSIPEDQFQEIDIKKVSGEKETLVRENGKWRMTEPKPLPADQDAVSSMVSSLGSLNADKVIEDEADDLKPYGLADPTLTITVKKKDGKTEE